MNITDSIPPLPHRLRRRGQIVHTVVLHATGHREGATFQNVVRFLQSTAGTGNPRSYHYLIDKDGSIVKGCPALACAFHAGRSVGPAGPRVNDSSVGIAFFNRNDGSDPYTPEQIEAVEELVARLQEQFPSLRFLTTHYCVSWGRKTDPRGFPIRAFAQRCGLAPWKSPQACWLE